MNKFIRALNESDVGWKRFNKDQMFVALYEVSDLLPLRAKASPIRNWQRQKTFSIRKAIMKEN